MMSHNFQLEYVAVKFVCVAVRHETPPPPPILALSADIALLVFTLAYQFASNFSRLPCLG